MMRLMANYFEKSKFDVWVVLTSLTGENIKFNGAILKF